MIIGDHRVIVIIVSQVSSCHAQFQVTAAKLNLNLALEMCLVDDGYGNRAVGVLESSYQKIISAASCIDADGTWTREAEVSGKSPKATRDFEAVVGEADKDGVAAGCCATVVLGAPPMEIAGGVAVDECVMPKYSVSRIYIVVQVWLLTCRSPTADPRRAGLWCPK
jgi:hypothetical protein